jgi:hypothetical protein
MAIITLEEYKKIMNISDLPDIITTGGLTTDSDIVDSIPDTSGMKTGDIIIALGVPDGSKIVSVDSSSAITIDASSAVTDASAAITITGRGSDQDEMITFYIPIVEDTVKEYCNNDFKDSTGAEVYPAALKPVAAQMIYKFITGIKQQGGAVKSESWSRYSVTYATGAESGASGSAPEGTSLLNLYRKVRFI